MSRGGNGLKVKDSLDHFMMLTLQYDLLGHPLIQGKHPVPDNHREPLALDPTSGLL